MPARAGAADGGALGLGPRRRRLQSLHAAAAQESGMNRLELRGDEGAPEARFLDLSPGTPSWFRGFFVCTAGFKPCCWRLRGVSILTRSVSEGRSSLTNLLHQSL